jgi:hypothetical protein
MRAICGDKSAVPMGTMKVSRLLCYACRSEVQSCASHEGVWRVELQLRLSLSSVVVGGGWSFLRPGDVRHVKGPCYLLNMRLGGQWSRSCSF